MSSQIQVELRLPDWSSLPADVIEVISNLTADDADFVRLRSVCTAWRSVAPERPRIPWLLVRFEPLPGFDDDDDADDADNSCLGFCNFPNTKFSTTPQLSQRIIRGNDFCGSSHGWIALIDDTMGISLHNPFTCCHIFLPAIANLPWTTESNESFLFRNDAFSVKRVLFSSDRSLAPYAVVAMCKINGRLIYFHSGDVSWTVLPSFIDNGRLSDVIFYKEEFYAVQYYRVFQLCDIRSENTRVTEILPTIPLFSDGNDREDLSYTTTSYLVESSGELLLVAVTIPHMDCDDNNCDNCDNYRFEVFRVDLDGSMSLFKLDTLGGRSLFLGCGSMSVSAPNSPRCRGDCIYYLMEFDLEEWEDKIVVFSMEDGKVSFIRPFSNSRFVSWEMYWLTPSLC